MFGHVVSEKYVVKGVNVQGQSINEEREEEGEENTPLGDPCFESDLDTPYVNLG